MNHKKQHVYILLQFDYGHGSVIDVYSNKESAERARKRRYLITELNPTITYHVIKKSVQGTTDLSSPSFTVKLIEIHREDK